MKLKEKPKSIKIPVLFHNLRGFDAHLVMQQIGKIAKNHAYKNGKGQNQHLKINAIPNNMEKYMAFMLGDHLTFIDSFQFVSLNLDRFVSNLPKKTLKYTTEEFTGKKFDLMSQIGVYRYDFIDCFEKFNPTKLPTKEQFYSVLNDQHITNEEYKHAKKVWKIFYI